MAFDPTSQQTPDPPAMPTGAALAPALGVLDRVVLFLAQGFGTGRAPRAPGTVGTLPGVLFFLFLAPLPLPAYLEVVALLTLIGFFLCDRAARLLRQDDPPSVVWDEIVGVLITLAGSPVSLTTAVAGFLAFRLFDIWKPWPIGWIDRRVHGGLGVMLDDVAAGLMGLAGLSLGRAFGAPW
jgi:phosphatidylglycerophosphatase A